MNKKIFEIYDERFAKDDSHPNDFEKDSQQLEELKELEKIANKLKFLSSVSVDENYYGSILPKFRKRQREHRYSFTFKKLAYTSSLAFSMLIMLVYSFTYISQPRSIQLIGLTTTQLSPLSENSYIASADQFSDTSVNDEDVQLEIDKAITQSISNSTANTNYVMIKSDNDYDKVLSQLNDEDLNNVYDQLQNTKIL